jgi:hypothetical protein
VRAAEDDVAVIVLRGEGKHCSFSETRISMRDSILRKAVACCGLAVVAARR